MKRGDGSLAGSHSCTILILISLMLLTLAADQLLYDVDVPQIKEELV